MKTITILKLIKITASKTAFSALLIFLFISMFGERAWTQTMLNDFETSLYSVSGGQFRPYHPEDVPPNQIITLDPTTAAIGSQSCKSANMLQTLHIWYIQNVDAKNFIDEAHNGGFDRFSFYMKIPSNYPLQPDRNCNVGTYTADPSISEPLYNDGHHYYHLFNIKGSEYWSKCVFNQHPRHRSGVGQTDPGVNPETWNYYDGFTRFYIQLLPYPDPPSPITLPFDVWVDNLEFYHTDEPENDDNISSIICTYEGDGQFWMSWRCNHYYDAEDPASTNPHEYRVYYATQALTNSNYNTLGTEVEGWPFQRETGSGIYDYTTTGSFNTGISSGTIYFAIKDISDGSSVVSKIDYHFSDINSISPSGSNPNNFILQQNYPNPFNHSATIKYSVTKPCNVQIKIFNQLGQEVCTLINEHKPAGNHFVTWDGKDNTDKQVSPGMYYYHIDIDGKYRETRNMLMIK